jgi:hypothetical protein
MLIHRDASLPSPSAPGISTPQQRLLELTRQAHHCDCDRGDARHHADTLGSSQRQQRSQCPRHPQHTPLPGPSRATANFH